MEKTFWCDAGETCRVFGDGIIKTRETPLEVVGIIVSVIAGAAALVFLITCFDKFFTLCKQSDRIENALSRLTKKGKP